MGAVFTDKVIVQRLTDFVWFCNNTVLNEQCCYHLARILHSLGIGLRDLRHYYAGLTCQPSPGPQLDIPELHPRFFPSIHTYLDAFGERVNFRYIVPLESDATCVTFRAETLEASPRAIVVKFVERYSESAHRLLAKEDAAPQLFYLGSVGVDKSDPTYGHLKMVVMEYLDGMTMHVGDLSKQLPTTYLKEVENILTLLHENGLVFGDLRSPNIMIMKDNKVKFMDFDWAGKEQESYYPLHMSGTITWPEGAKPLAMIEKSHDIEMLKRLPKPVL